jgi:hypothetical protein
MGDPEEVVGDDEEDRDSTEPVEGWDVAEPHQKGGVSAGIRTRRPAVVASPG